ncbi:hypothetical protein CC80DRAFT_541554 [Byssothecium circinans]|uniref:Uncharacterized protein n=1 Tax=Byssothecium circinans TaxID=147558 RepID=A0A6A5UL39_9PLEO|nr:hypothetical protein CC80DRAFT_541554 [Byssothecium circinans]
MSSTPSTPAPAAISKLGQLKQEYANHTHRFEPVNFAKQLVHLDNEKLTTPALRKSVEAIQTLEALAAQLIDERAERYHEYVDPKIERLCLHRIQADREYKDPTGKYGDETYQEVSLGMAGGETPREIKTALEKEKVYLDSCEIKARLGFRLMQGLPIQPPTRAYPLGTTPERLAWILHEFQARSHFSSFVNTTEWRILGCQWRIEQAEEEIEKGSGDVKSWEKKNQLHKDGIVCGEEDIRRSRRSMTLPGD